MNGGNIWRTVGIITGLLMACCMPVVAHAQDTDSDSSVYALAGDCASDTDTMADLAIVSKRPAKARLRTILRHVEREWPRLLLRYAQPVVRGLLADSYPGNNALALKTTLFRDNRKGLAIAGGVGRNVWGEREARLQFSLHF